MATSMFGLIQALFGGNQISEEKQQEIFAETLFMVLSGATRADLNIESVEVEKVKTILKRTLNREYSLAEIKLAGETDLLETAPIQKYVDKASKKLSVEQRQQILHAMTEVFRSDGSMGVLETDFYNKIAGALSLTPAQMLCT
ncbi:MAG: TerB family tellurite resistance protein [Gammaproteobacteria bacterium]|nr:TerB family tellurite resistance protein [Gammaproteobacteria bacterium]